MKSTRGARFLAGERNGVTREARESFERLFAPAPQPAAQADDEPMLTWRETTEYIPGIGTVPRLVLEG